MKKVVIAVVCASLLILIPVTSEAADSDYGPGTARWIQDETGWWYRNGTGTYPHEEWLFSEGKWYYFDEQGYMKTGLIEWEAKYYYLTDDGAMVQDVSLQLNGITYEFGSDGAAEPASTYKQPVRIPAEEEKTELMKANDAMADQILARITNASMTEREKAVAIYSWVRGNLTYSTSGTVGDWAQAANEGLRRKRGNCYTYYATSLELLSRVGISSVEVIRSKDNDHWWNLVYVDGAWYHFDTTPRRVGGDFCLLTTSQLMAYSQNHGSSHVFDQSLYPQTP